jgi:hypothetical protein
MPVECSRQMLAWIRCLYQGIQEVGEVNLGDPHLVGMLEFVVSEDLPPCCLQGGKHAHIQGLQLMHGVEGRTTKTISRCP